MFHNGILRLLPAVALASLILPTAARAQEVFSWKFAEGDHFSLTLMQETNSTTAAQGQEIDTDMEFQMYLDWVVQSVDAEGTATIVQKMDRVVMGMEMPFIGSINFDTDDKEAPEGMAAQFAQNITPLIGLPVEISVNPRREVVDFSIPEESRAAFEGAGSQTPFDEEGLRQTLGQGLIIFPAEPVSVGDQWNSGYSFTGAPLSMDVAMQYTYAGTEEHEGREVAVFETTSTMETQAAEEEGDDGQAPAMEMEITDQDSSGHIWFDNQAGHLVESNLQQTFGFDMEAPSGIIHSDVESEATFTMTPAEE